MISKTLLLIRNLTKSYQIGNSKQLVLKDVSFELKTKEMVAVIGESGAGKSTLLNLIAGLDSFDDGTVISCGYDVGLSTDQSLSKYRNLELGFIFQFHFLLEDLNVLENVCVPAWISGKRESVVQERAMYLLEQVGLSDKHKSFPSRLSGGERQRVAVARALINNPKLILADEPTGSLDAYHAKNVFELLLTLVQEGESSLLLVTHDLQLSKNCSRSLELKKAENH